MRDSSPVGVLFVATDTDPAAFAPELRREWQALAPNTAIYDVSTMAHHVRHEALVFDRLSAQIMSGVGLMGLVLSVLGLYSILAYSVSRRSHEIGIRIAIGATAGNILRSVLGDGLRLSVVGTAAGIVLSYALRSVFGVFFTPASSSSPDPYSPLVYVAVAGVALAVTILACYLPARRASTVDPNVTLRCE